MIIRLSSMAIPLDILIYKWYRKQSLLPYKIKLTDKKTGRNIVKTNNRLVLTGEMLANKLKIDQEIGRKDTFQSSRFERMMGRNSPGKMYLLRRENNCTILPGKDILDASLNSIYGSLDHMHLCNDANDWNKCEECKRTFESLADHISKSTYIYLGYAQTKINGVIRTNQVPRYYPDNGYLVTAIEIVKTYLLNLNNQEQVAYFNANKKMAMTRGTILANIQERLFPRKIYLIQFENGQGGICTGEDERDVCVQAIPFFSDQGHSCRDLNYNRSCPKCVKKYEQYADMINHAKVTWLSWEPPGWNSFISI